MNDNKLTEAQLLFRLQQFHGAEQEAMEMEDYEFAHECADVASIIRELQQYRKAAMQQEPVAYFSYGSGHNFELHKTAEEVVEAAEAAIDDYRGEYAAALRWVLGEEESV